MPHLFEPFTLRAELVGGFSLAMENLYRINRPRLNELISGDLRDLVSRRAEGATSAKVRDIASATDELASSVMEIDRQVAHSNAIAEKAVGEAERSNAAVQELSEAAKRIGDVVSLKPPRR